MGGPSWSRFKRSSRLHRLRRIHASFFRIGLDQQMQVWIQRVLDTGELAKCLERLRWGGVFKVLGRGKSHTNSSEPITSTESHTTSSEPIASTESHTNSSSESIARTESHAIIMCRPGCRLWSIC